MLTTDEKKDILSKLKTNNLFVLRHLVNEVQPEEIAAIINQEEDIDAKRLFLLMNRENAVTAFQYLDLDKQYELLTSFPVEQISAILNQLPPDDRTALFEHIPVNVVRNWLQLLNDDERKVAQKLLRYPESSIGRLMTTDYLAVHENFTVQQALEYIRTHGNDSETINVIYVVDEKGILTDDVRIRELILASPEKKIKEICDDQFVALKATDDQETAIKAFRESDRVALPVTDFDGILVGMVTADDVLDIIEQETTEDVQRIGGSEALDEPYWKVSIRQLVQKRVGWLVILFLSEMLTSTAMQYFQDEISKAVVLVIFMPLIMSSGGNSGSQGSTIIVRALALGEVKLSDWFRIMRREIISGLMLGLILSVIGFLRISLWHYIFNLYGPHWALLALTVSISLTGVVLWGNLSGSLLPVFLKRLGLDPAVSSAPFVATLVDVTGLIIYFSVAEIVLRGVLL
jgi:magnesium transporter